jgi:asparagine synthase (glutamine-hydrolysing)
MFAFAVWDDVEKSLFLARDRMGQKPLYVSCTSFGSPAPRIPIYGEGGSDGVPRHLSAIAFCSEVPALRPLEWCSMSVSSISLITYLRWGFVAQPASFFNGVGQLPYGVGQTFTRDNIGVPKSAWKDQSGESDATTFNDPVASTRRLLTQAVTRQLVSDVPLGCFLSGGIDSSVIAAAMARNGTGTKVFTFSIGFDDPRYDETEHAAAVAKHLGTDHRQFTVKPDAAADLPRLASVFGEPFGDSSALPTHYLARETQRFVKVALSGDGGDELFGGYDRYRAVLLASRIRRITTPLPWLVLSPLAKLLPNTDQKSIASRSKRFLESLSQPAKRRYAGYLRLMSNELIHRLVPGLFSGNASRQRVTGNNGNFFEFWSNDPVMAARSWDRRFYLPNDLLTKVDRCSMLHGLEVRSPFMDHELVQFAAGLTTDQLLKGGPKRMLREAFADDLPAWVFKRKKMGFAVPIGDWFRGELRPMLRDTLFSSHAFGRSHFDMRVVERLVDEHETKRVDHSQRLYALLMLELWWNTAR